MAWAPDYIESVDLKNYVRVPTEDTADDTFVGWAISAASRAVDHYCGRQFGLCATVETRYYRPIWDARRRRWVIEIDDLMTSVGLIVAHDDDAVTVIDDYVLRPRSAPNVAMPWTELTAQSGSYCTTDEVAVTAKFGWSAVPTAVKQATALQASRLVARRDAPFGVAGSPENGSELRLLAKLDSDLQTSLSGYKRWWGAV